MSTTPTEHAIHNPMTELTVTDKRGCCGNPAPAASEPSATAGTASTAGQPCCGTQAQAQESDSCCSTEAKAAALTAGATCCG